MLFDENSTVSKQLGALLGIGGQTIADAPKSNDQQFAEMIQNYLNPKEEDPVANAIYMAGKAMAGTQGGWKRGVANALTGGIGGYVETKDANRKATDAALEKALNLSLGINKAQEQADYHQDTIEERKRSAKAREDQNAANLDYKKSNAYARLQQERAKLDAQITESVNELKVKMQGFKYRGANLRAAIERSVASVVAAKSKQLGDDNPWTTDMDKQANAQLLRELEAKARAKFQKEFAIPAEPTLDENNNLVLPDETAQPVPEPIPGDPNAPPTPEEMSTLPKVRSKKDGKWYYVKGTEFYVVPGQ
jgi:hypothetical protein